jgi:hypothetical protein
VKTPAALNRSRSCNLRKAKVASGSMEDEIQLVRGELREDSDEIQEAKRKE